MEPDWAVGHLQVIRTLMERSAIYRRALAPIMLLLGLLGSLAAIIARQMAIQTAQGFAAFWMTVALVGITGAYIMVRRQAIKQSESFWSPPTRRVTQAFLPPLLAGLSAGLLFSTPSLDLDFRIVWLPIIWMALYGCALHAAGFFMPRGMKLFGWGFLLASCGLAAALALNKEFRIEENVVMGLSFGGFHLAYGVYLYFTERSKNAA